MLDDIDKDRIDDSITNASMEVAPPSRIPSGTQSMNSSIMARENTSLALEDSIVVSNAANAQVLSETTITATEDPEDEDMEDEDEGEEIEEDVENIETKADPNLYEVEYFMADDYRKVVPHSFINTEIHSYCSILLLG